MRIREITEAPLALASLTAGNWSDAGAQLLATASGLEEVSAFPGWTGDAAGRMRHRVATSAGRMQDAGNTAATTADLLDLHCRILSGIRAAVLTVIGLAEGAGMAVHPDGRVTAGMLRAAGGAADVAAAAFTATLRTAVASVHTLDAALAAKLTGIVGGLSPTPQTIPARTTPGMTGIKALSPARVTDGVRIDAGLSATLPPEVREKVLAIAEGAAGELRVRGLDPAEIGVTATTVGGEIGVVIGDIGTADKVTTLVSGMGSGDLGGLRESAALAGRITGPGQATVAWHGYAAPGDSDYLGAAGSGRAAGGGPALRSHQSELRKNNPDARLSIVGHSYGTRVIDEAAGDAALPLEADEIHLMGSPGMTADSADDLNLRAVDGDSEVHVHRHPGDIIGLVADDPLIHGDDPSDPGWGADFINGEEPGKDEGLWGDLKDLGASAWGLTDLDPGNEHSSYRTDERVLEELRK